MVKLLVCSVVGVPLTVAVVAVTPLVKTNPAGKLPLTTFQV